MSFLNLIYSRRRRWLCRVIHEAFQVLSYFAVSKSEKWSCFTWWTPSHEKVESKWNNPRTKPVYKSHQASRGSLHVYWKYLKQKTYQGSIINLKDLDLVSYIILKRKKWPWSYLWHHHPRNRAHSQWEWSYVHLIPWKHVYKDEFIWLT